MLLKSYLLIRVMYIVKQSFYGYHKDHNKSTGI